MGVGYILAAEASITALMLVSNLSEALDKGPALKIRKAVTSLVIWVTSPCVIEMMLSLPSSGSAKMT